MVLFSIDLSIVGHATWPAIVLDESVIGSRKGLNKITGEKSILVQFFGTHDFARSVILCFQQFFSQLNALCWCVSLLACLDNLL